MTDDRLYVSIDPTEPAGVVVCDSRGRPIDQFLIFLAVAYLPPPPSWPVDVLVDTPRRLQR